ncbi:DUF2505 domain-containing protein [Salinisphaera aquimarina]|uniref:DUF2505 domain-containing protein n=1 Tax=Salinisphaera aquimarina TaxID=2094031 RepID=A0ABV7ELM4_9GAMM
MKFEETFDFDFDADTILRMFSDEDYYLKKYETLGGRRPKLLDSEKTDAHFMISVRHALDATKLSFPDMLKKRIGDNILLRQTDTWELAKSVGKIVIDIEKAPVDITIGMTLEDRGSGKSQLRLAFDIDAQIPLLGGKIEKAIAGPITQRTHKDLELSNRMAVDYTG